MAGTNSQHGSQYGNGVIPEPAGPRPTRHHVTGDRSGSGDVAVLALTHVCSQRPVVEQDVVFIIEFKASAIHIRRADQGHLPVDGQGLGVQKTTLIFEDLDSGSEKVGVITPTCRTDDP